MWKPDLPHLALSVRVLNPALDKGDVAAYLKWIRSDAGQNIVKDQGYYPLPKDLRSN